MHILDLPLEIFFNVLDHLNYNDIYCISGLICSQFKEIFNAYSKLNRRVCIKSDQFANLYRSIRNGILINYLNLEDASDEDMKYVEKILTLDVLTDLVIDTSNSQKCFEHISEGLKANLNCKYLSFNNVHIVNGYGYSLLCNKLKNISHLTIKSSYLLNGHIETLCIGILDQSSVNFLDLSDNLIGDTGATHLHSILHRLSYLNLSKNLINFGGAVQLVMRINNTELETLDISDNYISRHCILYCLKILKDNVCLKSLKCNVYDWRLARYEYMEEEEKLTYLSELKAFESIEASDVTNYERSLDRNIYLMLKDSKTLRKFDISYVDQYLFSDMIQHIRLNVTLDIDLSMQINLLNIKRMIDERYLESLFNIKDLRKVLLFLETACIENVSIEWNKNYDHYELNSLKDKDYKRLRSKEFILLLKFLDKNKSIKDFNIKIHGSYEIDIKVRGTSH